MLPTIISVSSLVVIAWWHRTTVDMVWCGPPNDPVNSIDNREHCGTLYIDPSKSFYTVDHVLLLPQWLSAIAFEKSPHNWFQNSFCRAEYNWYMELSQVFFNIKKGVPQGSILGFVLFPLISVASLGWSFYWTEDTCSKLKSYENVSLS